MISIVLPTHKPTRINKTLDTILSYRTSSVKEIIVVENGSNNFQYTKYPNVTYLHSDKASANAARNYGWHSTSDDCKFVLFTDDDIDFTPEYFVNLDRLLKEHDPNLIGGSVHLKPPIPYWITEHFSKMLAELKWEEWIVGGSPNIMTLNRTRGHWLVGANFCVKKDFLTEIHGFDENFGYHGDDSIPNDEMHVLDKAETFLYSPKLKVFHEVYHRCNMEYMLKRFHGQGIADCRYYGQFHSNKGQFINGPLSHVGVEIISPQEIDSARQFLKNEEHTLDFIQKYIEAKLAYLQGFTGEVDNVF